MAVLGSKSALRLNFAVLFGPVVCGKSLQRDAWHRPIFKIALYGEHRLHQSSHCTLKLECSGHTLAC